MEEAAETDHCEVKLTPKLHSYVRQFPDGGASAESWDTGFGVNCSKVKEMMDSYDYDLDHEEIALLTSVDTCLSLTEWSWPVTHPSNSSGLVEISGL